MRKEGSTSDGRSPPIPPKKHGVLRHPMPLGVFAVTAVGAALYACTSDSSNGSPAPAGNPSATATGTTTAPSPTPTGTPPLPDGAPPNGTSPDGAAPDGTAPDGGLLDGSDAATGSSGVTNLGARVVLWLDATQGYGFVDGGAVWKDQSTFKNDAVQAAPLHEPGYIDGGVDGSVHGHAVVHFDGTGFLSIADNASLQWGTSDYAIYTAVRDSVPDTASYAIVYGKFTDGPPFPGPILWANYPYGPSGSGPGVTGYVTRVDYNPSRTAFSDGGMNDGVMRVVGVRKTGKALELRVGGSAVDIVADVSGYDPAGFSAAGRPAFIGGRPDLIQMLRGDIAELVAVKGTVADAEQAKVEAYLKTKFGL